MWHISPLKPNITWPVCRRSRVIWLGLKRAQMIKRGVCVLFCVGWSIRFVYKTLKCWNSYLHWLSKVAAFICYFFSVTWSFRNHSNNDLLLKKHLWLLYQCSYFKHLWLLYQCSYFCGNCDTFCFTGLFDECKVQKNSIFCNIIKVNPFTIKI